MWYKLNESIGIVLLVAVLGGGSIYGLVKVFSAPPLLRQSDQQVDARKNKYTRGMMREHDNRMRELEERHSKALKSAAEFGNQFGS